MDTTVMVVVIALIILTSPLIAGEIQHTEIRGDDRAAIPLNVFYFTMGGQLELNITRLSLLPVPDDPATSLSEIGFVLLPPDSRRDLLGQIFDGKATCAFKYPDAHKVLSLDQIPPASTEWNLLLDSPADYTQYTLVFTNCLFRREGVKVSMKVRSAMYNREENRSGGKPTTVSYYLMGGPIVHKNYFLFSKIYIALGVIWIIHIVLKKKNNNFEWIHYCMLATLLLKALSLFCEAKHKWCIDRTGSATGWWDLWFYTSSFLHSISFHTAIFLIGWQLSRTTKQQQSRPEAREKRIFLALVFLLLVGNATLAARDNACLYSWSELLWQWVSAFSYSACNYLVMSSSLSAMKKLLDARRAPDERRATTVLNKCELLSHYFKVVLFHIIIRLPYEDLLWPKYVAADEGDWIFLAALELEMLAFYAYTGYVFTPKEDGNPHPVISDDEEEEAAARRLDNIEKDLLLLLDLFPSV